jgi:hypothetical protein
MVSAVVGLTAIGWIGTVLGAAGCDENLRPGTTRADVCARTGLDSPGFGAMGLLYAFGPALVLVLLLAVLSPARRHVIGTACAIGAAAIASYAVVLSLVISKS